MKKHYNRSEWLLYKDGLVAGEMAVEMTGHLLGCEECQKLCLSLVDSDDIKKAESLLSPDFTNRVMSSVRKEKTRLSERRPGQKPSGHRRDRQSGRFVYYVAAASITLFLMTGGIFQAFVDAVPKAEALLDAGKVAPARQLRLDWPENLVTKASLWLRDFEEKGRLGYEKE